MLKDLNPTVRKYPHTEAEAFGYDTAIEGPYKSDKPSNTSINAEYWVHMVLAFAAGFIVHLLWGAK